MVPVKNGYYDGFQVEAHNGSNGALLWTLPSDYLLPPHDWTPSYSPTLTPNDRLYFAGAGGTVYYRDHPDSSTGATGKIVFYGLDNYNADPLLYQYGVFINTPITSDRYGNIYFGFEVTGYNPLGLQGGIARISYDGKASWVSAASAASDFSMFKVAHNCSPALSNDQRTLYLTVSNGFGYGFGYGYLLALDSRTLATKSEVLLTDPLYGYVADVNDDGTASPTVGPDGDVYYGVLEIFFGANHGRGWLLHFNSDLTQAKTPGAFGWDDTASIVPASLVPSYHGKSPYLLMTKYNNYVEGGGDGVNKIAILDPNTAISDPISGVSVMKEVLTIAGPTPDTDFVEQGFTHAVREWCINTAAIDPFTKTILANNEDGKLYRWDLKTNRLIEVITLTSGLGEAYTPTLIGPDGTVYAINNATLFAVGQ